MYWEVTRPSNTLSFGCQGKWRFATSAAAEEERMRVGHGTGRIHSEAEGGKASWKTYLGNMSPAFRR